MSEVGADPDTVDVTGYSALEWAQDAHVVNLLLQYNPTYKVQLTRTGYSNS